MYTYVLQDQGYGLLGSHPALLSSPTAQPSRCQGAFQQGHCLPATTKVVPVHPGETAVKAFIYHLFQDCDQSILVELTFVEPQLTRALALKALGRLDEAAETYRRILDIHHCPEAVEGLAQLSKGLEENI